MSTTSDAQVTVIPVPLASMLARSTTVSGSCRNRSIACTHVAVLGALLSNQAHVILTETAVTESQHPSQVQIDHKLSRIGKNSLKLFGTEESFTR